MHRQQMHIFAQIYMSIKVKNKIFELKYDNQRSIVKRKKRFKKKRRLNFKQRLHIIETMHQYKTFDEKI